MDLIKDLDQLQKQPIFNYATTCRVKIVLNSLSEVESQALEEVLMNQEVTSSSLTKLLRRAWASNINR